MKPTPRLPTCRTVWIAIAISLVAAATGCERDADRPGRAILIGIDGASPRVVNPLIKEGRLPNLTKIADAGARGLLRSAVPIHSPRIWNTIVTGKIPEKHGIITFSYQGRDGAQHLYTSVHRRARPVWSIASAAGLSVGIINMWNTYPLEIVNGVMVSDHILAKEVEGRHSMAGAKKTAVGAVVYPDEWNRRLERHVQDKATPLPDYDNPFADPKPLPRWVVRNELLRRYQEDGALAQMAIDISRAEEPDLMMVLLPGIDRISHYLWGVMEPPDDYDPNLRPTEAGRAAGLEALYGYYEYTDALIGEILATFGPDDLVIVVSDHGFEAGETMLRLTGIHLSAKALFGVVFARGTGIEPGSRARNLTVNDIAPTMLEWLRLPVAQDMDGSPASFLASSDLPPVKSYNGLPLEFLNPQDVPSGVEGEVLEHLKSLGYIESE